MQVDFTSTEKGRLSEVMNICASTAATALSHMLGKWVNVSSPKVFTGSPEKASQFLGRTETPVSAILLKVTGDLTGFMMVLFPSKSAATLGGLLAKRPVGREKPDEMDIHALKEAGNIAVGAALTAFSRFMGLQLNMSVPDVASAMLGSVVDGIFAELGSSADQVLVFRIDLTVEGENPEGMFLFLFDHSAAETILVAADNDNFQH
jgi:chemotaxis protein CheC